MQIAINFNLNSIYTTSLRFGRLFSFRKIIITLESIIRFEIAFDLILVDNLFTVIASHL